jgi:hypothetical protein
MTSKVLLVGGLFLAVLSALYVSALAPLPAHASVPGFVANLLPWLVGGAGILTGLLNTSRKTKTTLFTLIGLVVALTAILTQPFNPAWLSHMVFFVRVFFAHALLSAAVLYFLNDGH